MSVQDEAGLQFTVNDLGKNACKVTFSAPTIEDKRTWMSHLIRLQHRSNYDRLLAQILRKEFDDQPLQLPNPDV